ncbi:MAG: hypothetical protein KGH72_03195 [Candidatus Micrarchaeota archaeon]|nr:hypothetical protein [Candidatus Micrarchaeota archaeon]
MANKDKLLNLLEYFVNKYKIREKSFGLANGYIDNAKNDINKMTEDEAEQAVNQIKEILDKA